jgi:hypothetical protein
LSFANAQRGIPLRFVEGTGIWISAAEDTVTTSTAAALPTLQDGRNPKYVQVGGTTVDSLWIRFGDSSVACTVADGILLIERAPLIFDVSGFSHYAAIRSAGSTFSASITPLEV